MVPLKRVKRNGKVDLWDTGPTRPAAPQPPAEVDAKLKGADRAAAEVEYEDACDRYKHQLRAFTKAKVDYAEWHETNGGPLKVELWGVDARFALDKEPVRFRLDLPKGVKPGKAQLEIEANAESEAEAFQRQQAADPQFGQGVAL